MDVAENVPDKAKMSQTGSQNDPDREKMTQTDHQNDPDKDELEDDFSIEIKESAKVKEKKNRRKPRYHRLDSNQSQYYHRDTL